MKKIVPQEKAFDTALSLLKWYKLFSIISICLSILGVFTYTDYINRFITYLSLAMVCLSYFCKFLYDNAYINAEEIRRDGLIDNSYSTKLAEIESVGYYDSKGVDIGYKKMLINIFQNSLYTEEISKKMKIKAVIKTIIAFLVILAVICFGDIKTKFAFLLIQIFLSGLFVGELLTLSKLSSSMHIINNNCKRILANIASKKREETITIQGEIIREVIRYETSLAYSCIQLDKDIFEKLNSQLDEQWEQNKMRFGI